MIFLGLQYFAMALLPASAYLPATSERALKLEQKKSELRYYLILYSLRTRSIVILGVKGV